MRRHGLIWHIFPTYLLITIISVVGVSWYGSVALRTFFYDRAESDLRARAVLLESRFADVFEIVSGSIDSEMSGDGALQSIVVRLGEATDSRITLVLPDGTVVADTDEDPSAMENHADRPEIVEAMGGNGGSAVRFSHTLGMNRMYVAVPVKRDGAVRGVVRVSLPTTAIDDELRHVRKRIVLAALLMVALASAVSYVVSRRITRPLVEMRRGALRFAKGGLGYRLPVPGSLELASLSETLNRMAEDLDQQISTIRQQRAEQDAVFHSMQEGVIAVDADERLLIVNRAAGELLGVDHDRAPGRSIQEFIRNTDIHAFASRSLLASQAVEEEIELLGDDRRVLQARGAALRDTAGRELGAVIVLNDVTRMRELESVRTDFVANVSHELRTPVTLIQGFIETLLDGAIEDPAESTRFLKIVQRHSERLNSIIEDLLYLSRIEQDAGESRVSLSPGSVNDVVARAIDVCRSTGSEKSIRIEATGDAGIMAQINPQLLEHAIINLLDNAVKYSDEGAMVQVEVAETGEDVVIHVRDHGVGIAPEHLPRLFERFYRVDQSRSRELGGTGLGLAIAKHIAQAHGGAIDVQSTPGKGSTFTIRLPGGRP